MARTPTKLGVLVAFVALVAACGSSSTPAARPKPGLSANAIAVRAGCAPGDMTHMDPSHEMPKVIHRYALNPTACRALGKQLEVARQVALQYEFRYQALGSGYTFLEAYQPGTGSHYMVPGGVPKTFDVAHPTFLLYDGDQNDSRLVGIAYGQQSAAEPTFFPGPNDVPHRHAWCKALPGETQFRIPGQDGCTDAIAAGADDWFLHVWLVPGHPSPAGMFSPENPNLTARGWTPAHPLWRATT